MLKGSFGFFYIFTEKIFNDILKISKKFGRKYAIYTYW